MKDLFLHCFRLIYNTRIGRISVGEYIVCNAIILLATSIITALISIFAIKVFDVNINSNVEYFFGIITFFIWIKLSIQRCGDLNWGFGKLLRLIVPIYNIYIYLKLLLEKGIVGKNIYGEDPLLKQEVSNKNYRKLFLLMFFLSVLFGIIKTLTIEKDIINISNSKVLSGSLDHSFNSGNIFGTGN